MRRPRTAQLALALVVLAGVLALALTAGSDSRSEVQSTGVLVISPVASMSPGDTACQRPLVTADRVAGVALSVSAPRPSPALEVQLRDTFTHRTLARGSLPRGANPRGRVDVGLERSVPAERSVDVCVTVRDRYRGATLLGDDGSTDLCRVFPGSFACRYHFLHPLTSTSNAYVNGTNVPGTIDVALLRRPARSVLGQIGSIMRRASAFRPGFVGAPLWWLVLVIGTVLVPMVLWWGLGALPSDD